MRGPGAGVFALPEAVEIELTRIERRWAQLPLERARGHLAQVHELASTYAARTHPGDALPLLGAGAAAAQLRVVVYDVLGAGLIAPEQVVTQLSGLRRALG